jgi:hypothetical protein
MLRVRHDLFSLVLSTAKEAAGGVRPADWRKAAPNVAVGAVKQMMSWTRNFMLSRFAVAIVSQRRLVYCFGN